MSERDLLGLLKRPILTERSTMLKEQHGQYCFQVDKGASKGDIKRAVQETFKVKVTSVRTMILPGKERRMGRTSGVRADWKKAIVTLQKGQKIDWADQGS
jgi:large subunit ribosomal protein L23